MKIIIGLLLIAVLFEFTACNLQQTTSPIVDHDELNDSIIKPNSAAASDNMQLGLAYLQQGDPVRAKHKLLLALKQDPNSADVEDAMAYFLEVTGDINQAQSDYLRAIQLAPKSGIQLNNYGVFLCRRGEYIASEKQFLAAIQDPNYLNTAKAYENAGLCAQEIPDDNMAEMFFQKAIKQDPNLSLAWFELAQISHEKGDRPLALQYMANYLRLTQ